MSWCHVVRSIFGVILLGNIMACDPGMFNKDCDVIKSPDESSYYLLGSSRSLGANAGSSLAYHETGELSNVQEKVVLSGAKILVPHKVGAFVVDGRTFQIKSTLVSNFKRCRDGRAIFTTPDSGRFVFLESTEENRKVARVSDKERRGVFVRVRSVADYYGRFRGTVGDSRIDLVIGTGNKLVMFQNVAVRDENSGELIQWRNEISEELAWSVSEEGEINIHFEDDRIDMVGRLNGGGGLVLQIDGAEIWFTETSWY